METINEALAKAENDTPVARAELIRVMARAVYDFVKFQRSEGGGLDGRDGPERQSLATIVDAAEDHYHAMLKAAREK